MRTVIDDLPGVSVSRLRASGVFAAADRVTIVQFPDSDVSFTVALAHRHFPNQGSWSFFICACGRRARTIRLFEGSLACKGCLEARGLRYRVENLSLRERAAHVASRLRARLNSASPARLNPRPGRVLDRRSQLQGTLRRAELLVGYADFVKPKSGET
jgi:hypothetical protein